VRPLSSLLYVKLGGGINSNAVVKTICTNVNVKNLLLVDTTDTCGKGER
jgi:hypothetical protein